MSTERPLRFTAISKNLTGVFDSSQQYLADLRDSERLTVQTVDAGWFEPEQDDIATPSSWTRFPREDDAGHALTGPFRVVDARKGDALEVRIERVVVGSWGWSGARVPFDPPYDETFHLGWRLDAASGIGTSHHGDRLRLRPFPGIIGLAPPEPGRHSTIPPRRWGGNLDCRELVEGASLFLPVPMDAPLLYLGDGHATQGDGEVSGVAIECGLAELTIQVRVHRRPMPLPCPRFITPDGTRGTLGVGTTLDEATDQAVEALLAWLVEAPPDRERVPLHWRALASMCLDLRVTQVVNQTVGVHALWRADRLLTGGPT